jgi:ACS family hexuronate transporter-like MFS transporter
MWLRVRDRHPHVTPEEVAFICAGQDVSRTSKGQGLRCYLDLAKNRNVWGIVLGRALTDPIGGFMSSGCRNT